jgi:hypothetical protein
LAHKWNSIGFARNQIYGFFVRTRPETERIGGRKMRQEDIGNLKKSTKSQIIGERSFNGAGNFVIAALN